MAKTLVQQLTSATLKVNKNPEDAEAVDLMAKLAGAVGPKWVQANKPAALSPTRTAVVNGWIIQAGAAPVLAAADTAAPKALVTLMAILDGDVVKEQGWMAYAMGGDIVPPLGSLAAVGDDDQGQGENQGQGQGGQGQDQGGQGQGGDGTDSGGGSGGAIGLAIGLGVAAVAGIGIAVALSGKKKKRKAA